MASCVQGERPAWDGEPLIENTILPAIAGSYCSLDVFVGRTGRQNVQVSSIRLYTLPIQRSLVMKPEVHIPRSSACLMDKKADDSRQQGYLRCRPSDDVSNGRCASGSTHNTDVAQEQQRIAVEVER